MPTHPNDDPESSPFIENVESPTASLKATMQETPIRKRNTPVRNSANASATKGRFTPLGPPPKTLDFGSVARSRILGTPLSSLRASPRSFRGTPKRGSNAGGETQLKELVGSLEYQLSSLNDEKEVEKVQYEQTIKKLELQLKEKDQKIDNLESDSIYLFRKQNEMQENLNKLKTEYSQAQSKFDKSTRDLQTQVVTLNDENSNYIIEVENLKKSLELIEKKHASRASNVTESNKQLSEKLEQSLKKCADERIRSLELEEEIENLKQQTRALKDQLSDQAESQQFKSRLSEQVDYITSLEESVSSLTKKVGLLEDNKVLVDVIESEKQDLLKKLEVTDELRQKLVETELQVADLQSEQERWKSFVDKEHQFTSPEDVVRALMLERTEKVNLIDKVGRLEAELSGNSVLIENMRAEVDKLSAEVADLNSQIEVEKKALEESNREKHLAITEAELLRKQIESDSLIEEKKEPDQNSTKISELENLVTQYKEELKVLKKNAENQNTSTQIEQSPLKRKLTPFSSDERVTELNRKTRSLQVELDEIRVQKQVVENELEACKQQLSKTEKVKTLRVRVLELKDNPAAKHEAVKQSMLTALKKENEALMATVEGKIKNMQEQGSKIALTVPYSSYEVLKEEKRQLEDILAEKSKRMERLKSVFKQKSLEFKEAVFSLFGAQVDIKPGHKLSVTFKAGPELEQTVTFLQERRNALKFVSVDGKNSSKEFDNLVEFWIKQKMNIPCFLAAFRLELYEKMIKRD